MTRAAALPLAGRRLLLTRRPEQSAELRERLAGLGADVVEVPAIEVVAPDDVAPLDAALGRLDRYHWLLFTSANAARSVAERMAARGLEPGTALAGVRVGSVGPGTSEVIRRSWPGVEVAAQPESEFRAEGLLATLGSDVAGLAVLLPTSDRARDLLPETLRARGARVDVVVAYRTVVAPELGTRLADALARGVDRLVFASPSAVGEVGAALGQRAHGLPVAVIGPVTERAARAAGFDVRAVAAPSTVEGLVAALLRDAAS